MLRATAIAALSLIAACGGGSGSTCPAFTQIVAGDFSRAGDTLAWTLEVAGIPAEMTFNQAAVPLDVLEYRWAVDLDADGDGSTDLRLAATHFKTASGELVAADILSVTQEDLWEVTAVTASTIGDVSATLDGNSFRFAVDAGEDPRLDQITTRDQATWTTRYQFGATPGDACDDSLN